MGSGERGQLGREHINAFFMLKTGSVRSKNAQNVILKNSHDACVCALIKRLLEFRLALGLVRGWPQSLFGDGGSVVDFAGCSVVNMVRGFSGLTGADIVGPGLERLDPERKGRKTRLLCKKKKRKLIKI